MKTPFGRCLLAALAGLAAMGLAGCGLVDTSLVKERLDKAERTRLEVEASPYAGAVQGDLGASQEHQKKAREWLEKIKERPLIDAERKAEEYLNRAQIEADKSLTAAKSALAKVRDVEAQASQPERVEAPPPKETDLTDAAGPSAPIGSKPSPAAAEPQPKASAEPAPAAKKPPLGPKLPDDPMALYTLGLKQYRAGKYVLARRSLVAFLGRFPRHDLAVNAQYWIGETYYAQKEWVMALGAFQAVLSHYPKGRKAPAALVKIGLTEYNLGRRAKAKAALKECLRRYPNSNAAKVARRALTRIGRP